MKYFVNSSAIIDVTRPPYSVDNTGKLDCTATLCQILDDILSAQVTALRETHDKLVALSENLTEDAYIGIEGGRVQDGQLRLTFPEFEPPSYTIYFPNGEYLVSDTVTYTRDDLKGFWYLVPKFETSRNIHFLGESREGTVIRLMDSAPGFAAGADKPVVSFVNHEIPVSRDQEFTNIAFMNCIEDITIDCGADNPGAIGIKYVSSNCGHLENLCIRGAGGKCGIYVANNTTQCVMADLSVSGFAYGIDVAHSVILTLDNLDLSGNREAGILTGSSNLICKNITSSDIPTVRFIEGGGRYYFKDRLATLANDPMGNHVFYEETPAPDWAEIPKNQRSTDPDDWCCVDDFGAVGDGVTDSTRAIQRAMNSGKSVIVFGAGRYLIDGKIRIPKIVQTVDFAFCSFACGIRLIGGEYDAAFEVAQDSDTTLFVENLSAWEQFRGHIHLVKHAARRDLVLSDIHLMSASLYFNSVSGSHVYLNNCFLTTGTYTPDASIPGKGFVPVYSNLIPCEFYGQKVYGRLVNFERAALTMLNDHSTVILDGYRTEGPGTAVRTVNGGSTAVHVFNAGLGRKYAQNPLVESIDSEMTLVGVCAFGTRREREYNILIADSINGEERVTVWEDIQPDPNVHSALIEYYQNDNR